MLDWPRQLSASMGFSDLLLGMRCMSWAVDGKLRGPRRSEEPSMTRSFSTGPHTHTCS